MSSIQVEATRQMVRAACQRAPTLRDADPMALCLFTVWAVRTGRRLPDPPFTQLSPAELVEFWTDDHLEDRYQPPTHRPQHPNLLGRPTGPRPTPSTTTSEQTTIHVHDPHRDRYRGFW